MNRHRRLRHSLAAAAIVGFVGGWPALVDAHATFVGAPASVAAGTEVTLTMNVPHERDDTTYNIGIAIQLPDGWTGRACQDKPTWTCTYTTEGDRVVMHFDKDLGAGPAEDETFVFVALVGDTPGTVSFPTLQTYNDNTVPPVAWIGETAPTLQVTGAPPATTDVAVTPTNPPTTSPSAAPTVAPTTTAATTAGSTTTSLSNSSSTSTSLNTATSTTTTSTASVATAATTEPTSTTLTLGSTITQPSETDSGGSTTAAIVVIALAFVAAGTGLFFFLRRRSRTAGA